MPSAQTARHSTYPIWWTQWDNFVVPVPDSLLKMVHFSENLEHKLDEAFSRFIGGVGKEAHRRLRQPLPYRGIHSLRQQDADPGYRKDLPNQHESINNPSPRRLIYQKISDAHLLPDDDTYQEYTALWHQLEERTLEQTNLSSFRIGHQTGVIDPLHSYMVS